jgi:2,3-bisphosphoglycerate-independent phosphoglycerate mutase
MDRDKRWERVAKAYHLMVNGTGEKADSASAALAASYSQDITDEFLLPHLIDPDGCISEGDVVISFNFRTDRGRQITRVLSQEDFHEFNMHKLNLHYYTMTIYDETYHIDGALFHNENLVLTLGEVIQNAGATQLRAAETEKYPHVTFFFSGGREETFTGEERLLIASPKVATYDLQPEMSAHEVGAAITQHMHTAQPDFICLNFANPDMVGHTGVFSAIMKAVETVDQQLEKVVRCGQKLGYEFLVIADHGNADYAINPDGSPNTAHSLNPVPVVLVTEDHSLDLENGILADVAPTILSRMGLEIPLEMNGKCLVTLKRSL